MSQPPPVPSARLAPTTPAAALGLPTTRSPATAAEVVVTLGDSVVHVRHVIVGPRRWPHTRPVAAAVLAVAVIITLGVFLYATAIAADNDAAAARWLKQGRPAWAFRPRPVPVVLDLVVLVGGLVSIGAGVAWIGRRERAGDRLSIGGGGAAGGALAIQGIGDTPLLAPAGLGLAVRIPDGHRARMQRGGDVAEVAGSLLLETGTRLQLALGAATVRIAGVEPPRAAPREALWRDRRVVGFVVASAILHLAILMLLDTLPAPGLGTSMDWGDGEAGTMRFASISHEAAPAPPPTAQVDGPTGGGEAIALALAVPMRATGEHLGQSDHTGDREAAIAAARRAGVLDSGAFQGDAFGGFAERRDLVAGLDGTSLYGDGDGSGSATFGGGAGRGLGGDWGSIGSSRYATDPYGTIGGGGGPRGPIGYGFGTGSCVGRCRRAAAVPPVRVGPPEGLKDPELAPVIRRYIKRNLDKITYCYESRLLSHPGLDGTVLAKFQIHATGHVLTSAASGVDDQVSQCVAEVIRGIQFPRLADEGVFEISYPFLMHPAG